MAEVEHLIAELVDIGDDVNEIFSKVLGEEVYCKYLQHKLQAA